MAHELPFQRWMSVWVTLPLSDPTAQQSVGDAQVTPERALFCAVLVLGEATIVHEVPFQCSMSVCWVLPLLKSPTAQQLEAEAQVTPES